jgi:hypothetical protein
MEGKVLEVSELKKMFGVGTCVDKGNSKLQCENCLFNNFGQQREKLGETCGIVLIAERARVVSHNYSAFVDPVEQRKNQVASDSTNTEIGIIF